MQLNKNSWYLDQGKKWDDQDLITGFDWKTNNNLQQNVINKF